MTNTSGRSVAVECQGIVKSYGAGAAKGAHSAGIDLDMYSGELLMIVGPSGCGKTTLLSIVSAILEPDEGQCKVFGRSLSLLDQEAKTKFRGKNSASYLSCSIYCPP